MTRRTMALPLAALASFAILVAACGGGAATTAPGSGTPATQAPPVTQAPASTEGAVGTFPTASFHGDVNLEKLVPTEIGGEKITAQSMTGDQFLGGTGSEEFTAVLTGLGKTPKDLSVAFGFNTKIAIIAFQIKGVSGSSIVDAFKNASTSGGTLSDVSLGGKSGKKLTPADTTEAVTYIYVSQDVVFTITGSKLTDALLNEAFSKLP